jgi:hypothetical protein
MTDNITDQAPQTAQPFPPVKPTSGPMTNPPQPKSPRLAQALQWAAWAIRKKNRAAQSNNGQRVPLA